MELHKNPSRDEAIRRSLANVGIELIEYEYCLVHPPVDERRLYRFFLK